MSQHLREARPAYLGFLGNDNAVQSLCDNPVGLIGHRSKLRMEILSPIPTQNER
jgi:hypothetical protein